MLWVGAVFLAIIYFSYILFMSLLPKRLHQDVCKLQLLKLSLTVLAWVQAERGSLQHGSILANVPDVKVNKDWDGGETSNSEPSQHEDVCQHDELQEKDRLHLRCIIFVLK